MAPFGLGATQCDDGLVGGPKFDAMPSEESNATAGGLTRNLAANPIAICVGVHVTCATLPAEDLHQAWATMKVPANAFHEQPVAGSGGSHVPGGFHEGSAMHGSAKVGCVVRFVIAFLVSSLDAVGLHILISGVPLDLGDLGVGALG